MSEEPIDVDIPEAEPIAPTTEAPQILGPPGPADFETASNITKNKKKQMIIADALYRAGATERALAAATENVEASKFDMDTGLPNKKFFMEEAEAKLLVTESEQRSGRADSALVLVVDVKNLKVTNDNISYEAGTQLIKNAADLLRSVVRLEDGDIVGRLGGDEFGVVVFFSSHEISPEQMQDKIYERLLAKLKEAIAAEKITGLKWNSSISGDGKTLAVLLHEADTSRRNGDRVQHLPSKEIMPDRDTIDVAA